MIKRDGSLQSLWQGTVDAYPSKPLHSNNTHYDVIVAGGGITGISTAFLLQQSGKNCLVVEADNLCFGTTGGTTAHLNTV
ncbi:MAG: FAD-binding oxidoreductase, partial [Chitinophagaceae bacterium]|nr:FAD-binding oxidoreductase [Chitinophagaceae bacterium]